MKLKEIKLYNDEIYQYYEGGINNEEVLLLIHGNTSGAIFFEPIFNTLIKHYRVIAPDLRGFGNSSYLRPIETLNDLSKDLKSLLDTLNINKVNLLGWSLGGAIALDFGVTYTDIVNKIILLSSGSLKGYPVYKKDIQFRPTTEIYENKDELAYDPIQVLPLLNAYVRKDKAYLEQVFNYVIYNGKNKPTSEQNDRWLDIVLKQRNLVDIDYALATFNISNEKSPYSEGDGRINNLKSDILNIWGDQDLTVPKDMFLENVTLLPNLKNIIYENAGHSILIDDPERLIEDIIKFI